MTEKEFIESIDCCFPYDDLPRAIRLIDLACTISANAAFMVALELARVPRSKHVPQATLRELLAHLDQRLQHPLKDTVFPVARTMIQGQRIPDADVVALMERFRAYPGQYSALAVIYFAAELASEAVDSAWEATVEAWEL